MQNHSVHIVGAIGIWQAWKPHEGFQTSRDNVQIRSTECSRQVQKSKLNQTSNSQSKHQGTFEWHGWNLLRFVEQKGSLLLHITIGLCTACISSLSPPNEAMKGGHQHHNGIQGPGMGLVQRQMKKLPSHIHCMDGKDRFGDVFGWTTTNVGVTSVLFRIHFQIWRYRIDGSISTIWSDGILFYVLFTKFTTQIWLMNSMPSNPISHILICDKLYQFV